MGFFQLRALNSPLYLAVVGMLRTLSAPAGEYVLQTAAGSVLGRQFIAVAKRLGVKVGLLCDI